MKNLIFSPNLLNKNATAKNLIPLPKIEAIRKLKIDTPKKPPDIVNTL